MPTTIGRTGYFLTISGWFLMIPFLFSPFSSYPIQWYELASFIAGILLAVVGVSLTNRDAYMKNLGWKKWILEPFIGWRYRGDRAMITFGMMALIFTIQLSKYGTGSSLVFSTFQAVGALALVIAWFDILRPQSKPSDDPSNS